MAVEASQPLKIGHFLAKVDLKANQYGWVKIDGATGTIDVSTDHVGAIGVQQNRPAIGQPVTVVCIGVTKLRVLKTTTIAIGGSIGTGTTGCGVYLFANATANNPVGATGTHALVTAVVNCIPPATT
jgi:hypothetical protein